MGKLNSCKKAVGARHFLNPFKLFAIGLSVPKQGEYFSKSLFHRVKSLFMITLLFNQMLFLTFFLTGTNGADNSW